MSEAHALLCFLHPRKLVPSLVALTATVAIGQNVGDEARRALVGPMVGHVSSHQAHIWAYAGPDADLAVWYEGPDGIVQTVSMVARAEDRFAARATLDDLQPGTRYRYGVLRTDDATPRSDPTWQGRFTTAPPAGSAARFRMAVSSCMRPDRQPVQPSWYLMLAERPAFHLLLGDNVYADSTDASVLWDKHLEQRRVTEFAALIRNVPTYAMWDDHDYGPNNSDGTEPGKAESLQAFGELFAHPGAGTPETPGAFYRFAWGNVDFFVLDGRYYRSPNDAPNDDDKRMLGDEQFEWLVDGLTSSRAAFKVLASGSTLGVSRSDGWRLFDFARRRLFRAVMENHVGGVLYLSGDIHRCMLDTHGPDETGGYPMYEVISSGIANSATRGFVTLDFDTTKPDATVRIRILHGDATVRLDRTIRQSELQVR